MPSFYPWETLKAQAVFIEQYGWYYAMHWRGGSGRNGCYDLKDSGDGWYSPEHHGYTSKQGRAVDVVWGISVRRAGHFYATGYRAGAARPRCGADRDGWHLFQHSAFACGRDGLKWRAILTRYVYRPTFHLP
jgi:hypothetical protein